MGKENKEIIDVYGGGASYYLIKHSGLYNLPKILKECKTILEDLGYYIQDKDHSESVKPSGKELTTEWKCEKKVSEYVKFKTEVKIITVRQLDVKIKNKKLQKGDFEFRLSSSMTKNYEKSFNSTLPGKIQRHLYEKFIIEERLNDYEDKLDEEGKELIKVVKENLY
jgi:hypothetical protein